MQEIMNTQGDAIESKVAVKKQETKQMKSNLGLKGQLEKISEKYNGKDDILGMTLLTNPGYVSSARNMMFTSHLKQFRNLESPEFPKVYTGYENAVGEYSTAYYKAKSNLKVHRKISKFKLFDSDIKYLLFLYDGSNDSYSVIEKKSVENLTEKFGFKYNTDNMDSKEEGDIIKKGEYLYKSSSYDEDNNYCYGTHATFMYSTDTRTTEDGIVISKSFAEKTKTTDVESRTVSHNHNDIFLNLYGNSEVYKPFPHVGENIKNNILCASKRIINSQVLYDLKLSNLRKINFNTDSICYCDDGQVIDINMYCNIPIDEIPVNRFNKQIIDYLIMQKEYYEEILEVCEEIIDSGSKYSTEIGDLYSKAKDVLNDNVKWRDSATRSVFGFLSIEFTIKRSKGIGMGQKITGRYGNKGVVVSIVPDEQMPVLETGKTVDMILNTLGIINRTSTFQLFEQSIMFICNRTVERLKTMSSLKEKEELLFDIVGSFNAEQRVRMYDMYKLYTLEEKNGFFDDIFSDGIYINIKPLWEEDEVLFERISKIYDRHTWIKPYKVYINQFGRRVRLMSDLIIGEMYMLILKQTSSKGFNGRANGSISQKGIPQKPAKTKENRGKELYSKVPVRIGIDENYNALIGVSELSLSKLHLFYRNSIVARRYLGNRLMTDITPIEDIDTKFEFKNRNAEALSCLLKNMGMKLSFDDMVDVKIYDDNICQKEHDGNIFIGTKKEVENNILRYEVDKEFVNDFVFVGTDEEIEELKIKRMEIVRSQLK